MLFQDAIRQLWAFLSDHAFLEPILRTHLLRHPDQSGLLVGLLEHGSLPSGLTDHANVAFCIRAIEAFSRETDPYFVAKVGTAIASQHGASHGSNECIEIVARVILVPVHEWLCESLDDLDSVLPILVKYRRRSEWFMKEALFTAWKGDTTRGEAVLARDLYAYLFDHDLEFYVEPRSASGEADVVILQPGDSRLVADAKVFSPETGRGLRHLSSGVWQVYQYAVDHKQPVSCLVIFNTSDRDLEVSLTGVVGEVPYFAHAGRTIFVVTVAVNPDVPTASRRGRRAVHRLSLNELAAARPDVSDSEPPARTDSSPPTGDLAMRNGGA